MFQLFSPNMLKIFEQCPKKFYFRYHKNYSMPTNDDIFEFGKNIHAMASYYLKKQNIDKMEKSLNDAEKIVWKYLKNIKYFSYQTIATEQHLSIKINNYYFGGRLDALVRDNNNTYYILDYKTGTVPKNAKYDFQTMIYLLAAKTFYNTNNIIFVFIDLKNKSEVQIKLTDNLIKEYEASLLSTVNRIISSDFTKNNKEICKCEYNPICY